VAEFLLDPLFSDYRKREIVSAAKRIKESWSNKFDPSFFRGQMDMLHTIVNLVDEFAKTDEEKMAAKRLKAEAIVEFEKLRLRELVGSDE
jgi:hypothetical protein